MLQAFNLGIQGNKKTANINVQNDVYKKGYRRCSCTSKTAKKSLFRQIYNVLYHHYVLSRMLLAL